MVKTLIVIYLDWFYYFISLEYEGYISKMHHVPQCCHKTQRKL